MVVTFVEESRELKWEVGVEGGGGGGQGDGLAYFIAGKNSSKDQKPNQLLNNPPLPLKGRKRGELR